MMAISFKGAHFSPEVILMEIRWYLAYPLNTRHVEELMEILARMSCEIRWIGINENGSAKSSNMRMQRDF